MTSLLVNFLKLDMNIAKKYHIKILFNVFHILSIITLFYYISETIGVIKIFDAPYFPFVATGLAFSYLTNGITNASSNKIIEWRDMGILEGLLLSPKKSWQLYLGAGVSESIFSVIKFVIILSFISLFFLTSDNKQISLIILTTLLILGISIFFSLIETCSLLVWKRWSLLSSISTLSGLFLSGIYFPVKILPSFFQWVAMLNPFFHGLLLLRNSLGINSPDSQLSTIEMSFIVLSAWLLLAFIGSYLFYRLSEDHLHKTGGHFHV